VTLAAYLGTRGGGDTFNGQIRTEAGAVGATKPLLPTEVEAWRVTRVTLVREASGLAAVAPEFPASGLTSSGFPGPVWFVAVAVTVRCDSASTTHTLRYLFDASSGKPLIVSGVRCRQPSLMLG
jgi:hypothetical protein